MTIFLDSYSVTSIVCKRCGKAVSECVIEGKRVLICKSCIELILNEYQQISKEFVELGAKIEHLKVVIDRLISENNKLRQRLAELDSEKTIITNEPPEM